MPAEARAVPGGDTVWAAIRPYVAERLALALDRLEPEFWQQARELRLRVGRAVRLVGAAGRDPECGPTVTAEDLGQCLEHLTGHSLYAWEEELGQGFLTIPGGHRVGIAGTWSPPGKGSRAVRQVSALNYRIARSVLGPAAGIAPRLGGRDGPLSTLIVGPPGCGKTTLLRDLVRAASDGLYGWHGHQVSLVDERSEIAACHGGLPGHDVGSRTDVLDGLPKALGMRMALRSLGPEVLATDEIGGEDDALALLDCSYAGVAVLATAHAGSLEEFWRRPSIAALAREGVFRRHVLLSGWPRPGSVVAVRDDESRAAGSSRP